MRIRVADVLNLYAAGLTTEQILDEMPDLQAEDLTAALKYAGRGRDSGGDWRHLRSGATPHGTVR
jgi:uncharacterized protein (DUF433 family)